MRLLTLFATVPVVAAVDYGYWDVAITRGWAASGYKGWTVAANYSGTPGITKHGSFNHNPPPNMGDVTNQDPDFEGVPADNNQVRITQLVVLPDIGSVNITGSGQISCAINEAGRGCSGSGRINATAVTGQ
ncbi:hypothetical protein Sste5346_005199 [Sporothrix stenoceras]|uniref:Uncharacterized protein n=1 Tax=Sporothrix stenoceras TaxID=5173 RepID=A0ABR3Z582_9PEZI